MYEIRDPIHKSIEFNELEKGIIDHPYFARLRRIAQLGLASLVYPGATHNRFIHALGVMHVAGKIWSRLLVSSPKVFKKYLSKGDLKYLTQIVRLSALLHDVGHGPFSHAIERVMPPLANLNIPRSWYKRQTGRIQARHEDYSVLLIYEMAREKGAKLTLTMAQDIASLINDKFKPSSLWEKKYGRVGIHKITKAIISGELDADRMDYLLRDSYYAGVAYGHYDIDWLINNLSVSKIENNLVLTINEAGVRAFEDYLLARYHMFLQVYLHKTVSCFEYYLESIFRNKEIKYVIPTDAVSYAKLTDASIIEAIRKAGSDPKNYWSYNLAHRIPSKRLIRLFGNEGKRLAKFKSTLEKNRIKFFTRTSKQSLSSLPVVTARGESKNDSPLLVSTRFLGRTRLVPMEEFSDLLKTYNKKIHFFDIFIPREYWQKTKKLASILYKI